jgi:2-succinyl-5-enolpyruvyl-6-hydroxy-3-cyclohexene-1-carboxylate synthase
MKEQPLSSKYSKDSKDFKDQTKAPEKTIARNITQLWSYLIIDQLVKAGVKTFYTCPGMRNAPLLKAISLHPQAQFFSGWDERAQSYRALGFIKAKGQPAALVCTSGTAVANFLPATIEAQKTHSPLVILSADRPGELNATDANQTINQVEVLRNYCKNFWSSSEPQANFFPRALAGKISYLIHDTLTHAPGPLHLNIPLREPLDDTLEEFDKYWQEQAFAIINQQDLALSFPQTETGPTAATIKKLASQIMEAKNPLVVFGPLHGGNHYQKEHIDKFLEYYHANFSCDVASGLKFFYGAQDGLIPTLDHPEVRRVLESDPPDIILHFGHRITSKHYYSLAGELVNSGKTKDHILITPGTFHEDPGFSFTQRWHLRPSEIINQLTAELEKDKGATKADGTKLYNWEELIQTKRSIIEAGPLSYPFVTKRTVDTLSKAKQVFVGNSTFIRSLDSYAGHYSPEAPWKVISNRGASGIEGHLSAATGMLEANPEKPTVLFVGDISFIHDLNALAIIKEKLPASSPLLVLAVNNSSGGIFNLLPLAQNEHAKSYIDLLTTPHTIELTKICQGLELPCKRVLSKDELQEELDAWNNRPSLKILEIVINDRDNVEVYQKLRTVKL